MSRLVARYRAEGEAAFTPRSRRHARSLSATSPEVVELVLRLRKQVVSHGLDADAHTIYWHLPQHHHHGFEEPSGRARRWSGTILAPVAFINLVFTWIN